MIDEHRLQQALLTVGEQLADALPSALRRPMRAIDQKAMDLASADMQVKAALFRFVDVVPACHSRQDLARHLVAFLDEIEQPPAPIAAARRAGDTRAGRGLIGVTAARAVRHMAGGFIVGADPQDALDELGALWGRGVASSLDLLGEATMTHAEADHYAARCTGALTTVAGAARRWPARPHLEQDGLGPLPRVNLSVKVSALTPLMRADDPTRGKADAARRLRPLLRHAKALGAYVHIDMESMDTRDALVDLVLELLSEEEFLDGPEAGTVLQAYLRDAPETLDRILAWATDGPGARRRTPLTVRLVKGAYWDHEIAHARQHGWPVPVFEVKSDSDRAFELLTRRLLDARPHLRVAIASHNLRSVAHAIAYNRLQGGDDEDLELQTLRGLGDPLQDALASMGLRVRAYCPVGDLVAGMAYLVRRLLENTANDSFLQQQARGVDVRSLLAPPGGSSFGPTAADGGPSGARARPAAEHVPSDVAA